MKNKKLRSVNTGLWEDNYITNLNPIEKLFYLYLLTNPSTNLAGTYEISMRRIAFDTGIEIEVINQIIEKFQEDKKILYYEGYIILLNYYKDQSYNASMKTNVKNIIEQLPEKIKKFVYELEDESIKNLLTACNQPPEKLTPSEIRRIMNKVK